MALVLAHETGHRIGAIRQLRWSDIDVGNQLIRWRAENEKTGYEHRTPVTAEVLAVLEEARMRNPKGGNSPVLRALRDPSRCLEPVAGARLVGQGPETCRAGAQARARLALATAGNGVGPGGSATQGALRAGRLEDGPDGAPVLPEGDEDQLKKAL